MSTLRFLLNSDYTGANAFFALAQANGALQVAGLDIHFTPGRGAWTAAARLAAGEFDLAYGDINALAATAAHAGASEDPPLGIAMVHQHAPSTIAVARTSAIHTPADLAGKRIVGHASDVALQTFPMYARACGLPADAAEISTSPAPMHELLTGMLQGGHDAVFGYVTTHTAALASTGKAASEELRFLNYPSVCPDLYGSALMASAKLMRDQPDALRQLVRVLRASVAAVLADPAEALDAVLARSPKAVRAIEAERLRGTVKGDMGLLEPPLGPGWGDIDDRRMSAGLAALAVACGWPSVAVAQSVFTREFLSIQPGWAA